MEGSETEGQANGLEGTKIAFRHQGANWGSPLASGVTTREHTLNRNKMAVRQETGEGLRN